ncbi:MAG TPA: GDSL-type esterase/lipase family protein [Reyranella sp.]|nr:GDSL-type esterase/lipase family protein [Reyranella sp.]
MTRRTEIFARTALVAVSLLAAFLVLEVACRLHDRRSHMVLHWGNLIDAAKAGDPVSHSGGRYAHDALLGWVQRPNFVSADYSVDASGHRRTGPGTATGPAILAVGDSFTDGEGVADGETWPSYLETEFGRRTINAGVAGYGFDQMLLRAEREAGTARPALVIVSFIAHDLSRLEFSRLWFREKPWFAPDGDAPALKHVPVPPNSRDGGVMPALRTLFGWSLLIETVAERLDLIDAWYGDTERVLPVGAGDAIACRLVPRLARLGPPVLVVAQYDRGAWPDGGFDAEEHRRIVEFLHCAERAGLATLDLFEPLRREIGRRGLDALYDRPHHTAEGNRFVAHEIARALAARN